MKHRRIILHVDMDAFFAAVEQRDNPALRGRPVLVGGDGPRGVVATASYEARKFGCHSALPMAVAKRRCPDAIVVAPRGHAYREASDTVFRIFQDMTPLIEPLSIDEAFLDLTGSERLLGPPSDVARTIKRRVEEETGLTASVGIAPNKFLAKLASDLDKPDGLVVIEPDDVQRVLDPLPITKIFGIGPASATRFQRLGIETIGALRAVASERLTALFGVHGKRLHQLARGIDDRPVVPDGRAKSIGQECTFAADIEDPDHVRAVLRGHVEAVARRLRKSGLRASTLTIKVRYGNFETVTRAKTLPEPTHLTERLLEAAAALWETWCAQGFRPVRLIGATASKLTDRPDEPGLFVDEDAQRLGRLDAALDQLQARYGTRAVHRGDTRGVSRTDGLDRQE